jgi:hypothetical protein
VFLIRDDHIVGYYAPATGTGAEEGLGHRGGILRNLIQAPASELPRILLPRTQVNRVGRLGMAAKEDNWSIEEVDGRVETTSLLSGRFFFVILCNQEGSLIG